MAAPNLGDYNASKHGVVGLGKTLAKGLARHRIRVNILAPAAVGTDMMLNPAMFRLFCPDLEEPTVEDLRERSARGNPMGVPWLEVVDIANAALWLISDEARYVTGISSPSTPARSAEPLRSADFFTDKTLEPTRVLPAQ